MDEDKKKNLEVADAGFFRDRRKKNEVGEPIEICGTIFKIGRPSLSVLTKSGVIPNELVISTTSVSQKIEAGKTPTAKELEDSQRLERLIVISAVKSPKVVDKKPDEVNYDAGEISIEDLNDEEINEINAYVQGGSETLNSFRLEQQRQITGLGKQKVSEPQTK